MNPVARLYWISKGVGWRNLPRRLLQAWRLKSGSLRRRLDPANFSDEHYRKQIQSINPAKRNTRHGFQQIAPTLPVDFIHFK